MRLNATFSPQRVVVQVNPETMGIRFFPPVARDYIDADPYMGEYTITPTDEEQILLTENKRMIEHLHINPIPSNYGKITWNGTALTVS